MTESVANQARFETLASSLAGVSDVGEAYQHLFQFYRNTSSWQGRMISELERDQDFKRFWGLAIDIMKKMVTSSDSKDVRVDPQGFKGLRSVFITSRKEPSAIYDEKTIEPKVEGEQNVVSWKGLTSEEDWLENIKEHPEYKNMETILVKGSVAWRRFTAFRGWARAQCLNTETGRVDKALFHRLMAAQYHFDIYNKEELGDALSALFS